MPIVEGARPVIGGVDTGLDVHVAAALDDLGALSGTESFATTPAGYAELFDWLARFGPVARVGVEGTGSYGAGLCRSLLNRGIEVVEVDCPNRKDRNRAGESDVLDAVSRRVPPCRARPGGCPKAVTVRSRRCGSCSSRNGPRPRSGCGR